MFSLNIHVSIIVCFKLVKKSLKDDLLDYLNSKQCILLTGAVNFANKPLIGIHKAGKLLRSATSQRKLLRRYQLDCVQKTPAFIIK